MPLPAITNNTELYIAMREFISTKRLRQEMELIEPAAGSFLDPLIEDFKSIISDYLSLIPPDSSKTDQPQS